MKISLRISALLLAVIMIMTSAACGKDEPSDQPQSSAPVVSQSVVDSQPEKQPETGMPDIIVSESEVTGEILENTDEEKETEKEEPVISDANLPEIGEAAETESEQAYIEVVREGIADRIPVEIINGQVYNYTIAMDPAYFSHSCYEGIDSFTYSEWEGERSVYYCVYPCYDITPDALAEGITHQYSDSYTDCTTESVKTGEYDALAVYLGGDINAPDYNMHFFIIECDGGCIVIETQFCFEMYEGLYAIMRECFNTFTIVETD